MIYQLLDRLFGPHIAITNVNYCNRWEIWTAEDGRALYLHHFIGSDTGRFLHDHPKRFVSIGLRGKYLEETPDRMQVFGAPWIRSFPAEHRHRLSLLSGTTCWTLVLTGARVRPWGFWDGDLFKEHRE